MTLFQDSMLHGELTCHSSARPPCKASRNVTLGHNWMDNIFSRSPNLNPFLRSLLTLASRNPSSDPPAAFNRMTIRDKADLDGRCLKNGHGLVNRLGQASQAVHGAIHFKSLPLLFKTAIDATPVHRRFLACLIAVPPN